MKNKDAIVLIDDDSLVHLTWKLAAKKSGKQLYTFSNPQGFLEQMDQFDFDVCIYIDSQLEDGVRGEVFAKKLHEAGFKNLFLETGYSAKDLGVFPWIQGIVGKDPPF